MKRIVLFLTVVIGCIVLWAYSKPSKIKNTINTIEKKVSQKQIIPQKDAKDFIFIPYWTLSKNAKVEDRVPSIYFGLGVDKNGVDLTDDGYRKLPLYIEMVDSNIEKILGIRMTDKAVNATILKDISLQEKIASSSVALAKKYGFDGVLLDYETSAFGFDTTTNNIYSFFKLFSQEVKKENLDFYTTLYGDTYFRARPYDVARIGKITDKIFIMAYDFSKSRGNPGPNFPMHDNNNYGYDFEKMVNDFQKDVDNSKLVVIFGYFGYDWRVDSGGEAVGAGVPLSTNEITKEFVENCEFENCILNRVPKTLEPSISYKDGNMEKHIIWFEDQQSVDKKKELLKEKGILQTASWAYSYY